MKCPKCDTDFEGNVCPNCNTELSEDKEQNVNMNEVSSYHYQNEVTPSKGKVYDSKPFKIGRIVVECILILLLFISIYTIGDISKKRDDTLTKYINESNKYEEFVDENKDIISEYNAYKEKMKPYEEMELAEANAKRIEAEKVAADKKALEEKAAADKKAAEDKVAAEAAAKQQAIASATTEQKNALNKAKDYLNYSAFSHSGLIEQLEYEGFSTDSANYAVDNCGADWNVQAEKKAKDYMSYSSFSHSGLVEQLVYEGFTQEQAEHGASTAGY